MQQAADLQNQPENITASNLQKVIPIIPLKQWILKHSNAIESLGTKQVTIDNLSPNDFVFLTKSFKYNKVFSLQDTHRIITLDMPPKDIKFFRGNQFIATFKTEEVFPDIEKDLNFYLRLYYHRSVTTIYSSIKLEKETNLLPFSKKIVTERSILELTPPNLHTIGTKLVQESDLDKYISRFSLLSTEKDNLPTNSHLLEWLFNRYTKAYDISTNLTIEDIMLDIIGA